MSASCSVPRGSSRGDGDRPGILSPLPGEGGALHGEASPGPRSSGKHQPVDVIKEGFDIAIRVHFPPLDDSALVVRTRAESTQRLVASLDLVERCFSRSIVPHDPRLVTEDMAGLRQATLFGIGAGQFPTLVVQDDLSAGRLIDILPHWAPRAGIIHAVFLSRRGLLSSVRALVDYLAAEYAALNRAEQQIKDR